ncbi:MAG: 2-C-methyl-D-erythritol 2,4-cyclodiphosphate synthase [Elusimicrobia bacterium]|nr:2-C-methyl-D-erythritol 2,4-cyclodiphosphate synthase [Elusimicrobiota bacterium]
MLIGSGFDLHRLRASKKGALKLAGINIPAPYVVLAHSDGDLLFHAFSDALASALGDGDIGAAFPPGIKKTRGMDSRRMLDHFLKKLKERSLILSNISVVLTVEKPRLNFYRDDIRRSLASATGLPLERVGLTIKTFEGIEPLAPKAIMCWVNCLIGERASF